MPTKKTRKTTTKEFKASDYKQGDPFKPNSSIPSISEAEETKSLETIAGQKRALNVAAQNAGIRKAVADADAKHAAAEVAEVKALTAWEKLNGANQALEAEKQLTLAAAEQVTQGKNALAAAKVETRLRKEGSAVRNERIKAGVEHERNLFAIEKQQFAAELSAKRQSLKDRFGGSLPGE